MMASNCGCDVSFFSPRLCQFLQFGRIYLRWAAEASSLDLSSNVPDHIWKRNKEILTKEVIVLPYTLICVLLS